MRVWRALRRVTPKVPGGDRRHIKEMTALDQTGHTEAKCGLVAEVARTHGEVRLKVTGTSMLPSIFPGDILTVRRQSPAKLRTGHIVLCYRNEGLVAHRLIGKIGNGLITRGDSLLHHDQPFHEDQVLGQVVSVLRDGRVVDPSPIWWRRAAACVLRHSELCIRILLRLRRPLWAS